MGVVFFYLKLKKYFSTEADSQRHVYLSHDFHDHQKLS